MMRAASVCFVVVFVVVTGGCVAVTPRLPVPLRDGGLEVSGFGGGTVGIAWDVDTNTPYGDGFGGVSVAANVLDVDDISVEVDGGAGVGVFVGRNGGPRVGSTAGFRGWWNAPRWSIGGELRANSSLELAFGPGRRRASLQPELRFLAGASLVDGDIWVGARPGVILPLNSDGDSPFPLPLLDLPVSFTVCPTQGLPLRLGVEVGVAGPIMPTAVHGGVSAGFVF